ncbi:hypothetical protein GOBAR_AA02937 [Gossypium barbadense]|uniref:Uncharacterized protein n=1 Tax=Gossypium barbadense TaxID=3634 RepID=A0A2P5YPU6_GOSBA|nr:hypothetical protein GOBAR_AA02937 [Gossypium barbadense]
MISCPLPGSNSEAFSREVVRDESATLSTPCCLLAGVPDASRSGSRRSSSAPTPPEVSIPIPCGNTHAMVTRSKAGVFKPKVLSAETVEFEPCSVDEALAHPEFSNFSSGFTG